jgi:hypothetical protein
MMSSNLPYLDLKDPLGLSVEGSRVGYKNIVFLKNLDVAQSPRKRDYCDSEISYCVIPLGIVPVTGIVVED